MMKVSYGLKHLIQADRKRKPGQKIPVCKMLQNPSAIPPSMSSEKALQIARRKIFGVLGAPIPSMIYPECGSTEVD